MIANIAPAAAAVNAELPSPMQRQVLQGSNRIVLGASVRLWSIEGVAEDLSIPYDAAAGLVTSLGLPVLHLPGSDKRYVSLYALESAFFSLSLPTSMVQTPDGARDPDLIRLHQELAGAMYMAAQKEAIRQRVKKLARQMTRGLTSQGKRPIIGKKKKS